MRPRRPGPDDVPAIAKIVNDWIDRTPWMERDISAEAIESLIAEGMPKREMWVIGDPVIAYLSCDPEIGHIWALYCAEPGRGLGKILMDKVKEGRSKLSLNTHVPNVSAQSFYRREGFKLMKEFDPEPPATVRELRMEWER